MLARLSNSLTRDASVGSCVFQPPLAREDRAAGKALEYLAARPGRLLAVLEKIKAASPAALDASDQTHGSTSTVRRDPGECQVARIVQSALPQDLLAQLAKRTQTSEHRVLAALVSQFDKIESWIGLDSGTLEANARAVERVINSGRVRMFEHR